MFSALGSSECLACLNPDSRRIHTGSPHHRLIQFKFLHTKKRQRKSPTPPDAPFQPFQPHGAPGKPFPLFCLQILVQYPVVQLFRPIMPQLRQNVLFDHRNIDRVCGRLYLIADSHLPLTAELGDRMASRRFLTFSFFCHIPLSYLSIGCHQMPEDKQASPIHSCLVLSEKLWIWISLSQSLPKTRPCDDFCQAMFVLSLLF